MRKCTIFFRKGVVVVGGGGSNGCLSLPGRDCLWHIFVILCYFKISEFSGGGGMSGPHDSPLDPRMLNRPYLIREGTPPPLTNPTWRLDLHGNIAFYYLIHVLSFPEKCTTIKNQDLFLNSSVFF